MWDQLVVKVILPCLLTFTNEPDLSIFYQLPAIVSVASHSSHMTGITDHHSLHHLSACLTHNVCVMCGTEIHSFTYFICYLQLAVNSLRLTYYTRFGQSELNMFSLKKHKQSSSPANPPPIHKLSTPNKISHIVAMWGGGR